MDSREKFSSRLGFLLISAGCAIGLGNVWRFPYITGEYGGGIFVLIYLFFLLVFGLPILIAEFSVGRASRRGLAKSFEVLEKPGTKWHVAKYMMIAGNYLLMMFYTTVTGWMIYYFYRLVTMGDLLNYEGGSGKAFGDMLANPSLMIFWMGVAVILGLGTVSIGLQKGVEKITKKMMICLLVLLVFLVIRAVTLPGAMEGIKFYLIPDFSRLGGDNNLAEVLFAAVGQSFFTLSIGIGSMSIFGSYIDKTHSLTKEAANICLLDTFVALMAGMIIIPACFAFNLEPGQGPGLIFVTLPKVFEAMPAGRFFGSLFFLFLAFAALSTLIAVFENIVAFWMDLKDCSRAKAVKYNIIAIIILSLPCALGFNVLSGFEPFGAGSGVLDLEDFLVSNTILPIGSLIFILFCNHRYGWGQENFYNEVNTGKGWKLPAAKAFRFYLKWVLPTIVIVILAIGYLQKFAPDLVKGITG